MAATFAGIEPAILTARRLQWAIQGFSQSDGAADVAVAILLQGSEDETDPESTSQAQIALEQAAPGQILITPKTAEFLQNLPSLPLQAVAESALQKLLWRNSAIAPTRSADEEAISAFIEQKGLESEAPPLPKEPVKVPAAPTKEAKAPGAYAPVVIEERPGPSDPGALRRISPRLLVGVGGGAVALLAIVGFFAFSHKGQSPSQEPVPTPSVVGPSAPGSPANIQNAGKPPQGQSPGFAAPGPNKPPAAPAKSAAQIQKDRKPKGVASPPSEATNTQEAAQKEKGGNCTLEPSEVPKMLAQADNNRGAGHYEDALRQYSRVLACDRESARARNGLELTRLAMQHQ